MDDGSVGILMVLASVPPTALRYVKMKEYNERIPFRRRTFTLDKENLYIVAKPTMGNRYESVIPLREVRKEKDTSYIKGDVQTAVSGVPGCIALLFVIILSGQIIGVSVTLFFSLLALSAVGIVCGFVFAKKNKFYIYHYCGGSIAFDIGENGNQSPELEAFVEMIDQNIEEVRGHNKSG